MATKQLIETSIWNDKWFRSLSMKQKLLFIYFITNPSINPAGMYEVDDLYIKHSLKIINVDEEIKNLEPKIMYDKKKGLIWIVKYFLKNSRSPKIKKSVENTLDKYNTSFLVGIFLKTYKHFKLQVNNIEYQYIMDTSSIVSNDNDNDNDNDNESDNENENASFDFENLYQMYPRKVGKGRGIKLCKSKILNQKNYEDLSRAIANYSLFVQGKDQEFTKHFSSFMSEWMDWVDYEHPLPPEPEKSIWSNDYGK